MLLADPDAPESPLGRTTRGVLVGVVITALVAAGSLVYGLMSPGGNGAWRASGTLVVNRETGARYVYVGGRSCGLCATTPPRCWSATGS